MQHYATAVKAAGTAVILYLSELLGWEGWLLLALLAMMSADFLTGWILARHEGVWSSSEAKRGLLKKLTVLILISVSGILDGLLLLMTRHLPVDLPFEISGWIFPFVVVWFVLAEIGSVIENCVSIGSNIPPFLIPIIQILEKGIFSRASGKIMDIANKGTDTRDE